MRSECCLQKWYNSNPSFNILLRNLFPVDRPGSEKESFGYGFNIKPFAGVNFSHSSCFVVWLLVFVIWFFDRYSGQCGLLEIIFKPKV